MRMGRCFCASRGILKHCQSLMYMVITNSLINFGNIIVSNYKPNFGLKSLNLPFRNILLAIIKNEDGCGRFWFSLDIGFLGEWLSEFNDPQQTLHCPMYAALMLSHAPGQGSWCIPFPLSPSCALHLAPFPHDASILAPIEQLGMQFLSHIPKCTVKELNMARRKGLVNSVIQILAEDIDQTWVESGTMEVWPCSYCIFMKLHKSTLTRLAHRGNFAPTQDDETK